MKSKIFITNQEITQKDSQELRLTICTTISVAIVGLVGAILNTDNPAVIPWLKTTAVSIGLIVSIYGGSQATRNLAAGIIFTLTPLWGVIAMNTWLPAIAIAAFCAYGCKKIIEGFKSIKRSEIRTLPLIGAIGATTIIIFSGLKALGIEAALNTGSVYIDTLYHGSITAMLKTYGEASTGIHGLNSANYYTFSHSIAASIARYFKVNALESYQFISTLFFLPLLFYAMTACAMSIANQKEGKRLEVAWTINCIGAICIPSLLSSWGMHNTLTSESHALSVAILFACIPTILKEDISKKEFAVLLAAGILLAATKSTTSLLFSAIILFRAITSTFKELATILALLGLVIIPVAFKAVNVSNQLVPSYVYTFRPFSYIRSESIGGLYVDNLLTSAVSNKLTPHIFIQALIAVAVFLAFHFIVTWVALGALFIDQETIGRRKLRLAVILIGMLTITCGIMMSYKMLGAELYLSSITQLVSLTVIAGLLSNQLQFNDLTQIKGRVISGALLACLAFLLTHQMGQPISIYSGKAKNLVKDPFIEKLEAIRDDKFNKNAIIQASQSDRIAATRLSTADEHCKKKLFMYPAVSERAWVDIVKNDPTCQYYFYGLELLKPITEDGPTKDAKIPNGYEVIKSKNFK